MFGIDGVNKLRDITLDKSKDSNFILTVMRLLYADDENSFKNLTVTGRKGKDGMQQQKLELIEILFRERLHELEKSGNRLRKLNTHIKNSILNQKKNRFNK